MTHEWKSFKLRVFIRVMEEEDRSAIVRNMEQTFMELRIPADVFTISNSKDEFALQSGLHGVALDIHY